MKRARLIQTKTLLLLAIMFLVSIPAFADGGIPLTFIGARPLGDGEEGYFFRYIVMQNFGLLNGTSPVADPMNRKTTVEMAPFIFARGVTKDTTLVFALPYANKTMSMTTPAGTSRISNSGLSDLQVIGLQRLWHVDYGPDATTFSLVFGSTFPTASSTAKDANGNLLPPPMQLGLGNVSPLVGLAYQAGSSNGQTDASIIYQQGFANAQGFNPGNTINYNLRYGYRIAPRERFTEPETYLALELDGTIANKAPVKHTISLVPVIQHIVGENWLFEAGYIFPIVRNMNGIQLAPQNGWIIGFRYIR